MSDSLSSAPPTQVRSDIRPEGQYDEIDLIDLIGFLWRSRKLAVGGVVLGCLIGLAAWF